MVEKDLPEERPIVGKKESLTESLDRSGQAGVDRSATEGEKAADKETTELVRASTGAVFFSQGIGQLVSLISLVLLYRLIEPAEYGLLAMVLPVVFFWRLFSTGGLNTAAVQKEELTPYHCSQLFWWQVGLGLLFSTITALSGLLLSEVYNQPRLVGLLFAFSGTTFLLSGATLHLALLERRLALGKAAVIRMQGLAYASLFAVFLAWQGFGIWAIVFQHYIEAIFLFLLAWRAEQFRPRFVNPFVGIGNFLRFGGHFTLSGLLNFLPQSLDKLLLAYFLGQSRAALAASGFYGQMFQVMAKPIYSVTFPIGGMLISSLSKLTDKREEFAELGTHFLRLASILLAPCAVGGFVVARRLVVWGAGEKWASGGQILQILSPSIYFQGLLFVGLLFFVAQGATRRYGLIALIQALVFISSFWVVLMVSRAEEAVTQARLLATTFTILQFVSCCVWLPYIGSYFGLGLKKMVVELAPSLMAAIGMGGVVATLLAIWEAMIRWQEEGNIWEYFVTVVNPQVWQVPVALLVGVFCYCLFAKEELRWFLRELRQLSSDR